MERILSDNEKIRRAEEIYYRRNHKNVSMRTKEVSAPKTYLGSKILLEMLILVLLATLVFAVKNKDYIFTENFLNSLASYNINLSKKFEFVKSYFVDSEESNEVFINSKEENQSQDTNDENKAEETQVQQVQENATTPQSMVTNVESIKNSYHFIKPLEGIISSGFGARESVYQNVQGEHKGIDIASDAGTKIKAAMTGIVTQVSTEGDYGNHIKITRDNVTTLYAHCQEMYVVEGQEITEGQEIATVGNTGNSTGPHLHFEIRINDQYVNPAEIIQF